MHYQKYTKRNLKKNKVLDFFGNFNVTRWIILANVVFFILAYIIAYFYPSIIEYIALKPANILAGKKIWTLLTSMFMHGGIGHLLVNMISLMFIGNFVERIIGRKRFFWFYMISGIISGLFFVVLAWIFNSGLDTYAVGASGAIFALGGLLMILTPRLPVLVFFIIPLPMWIAMLFMLFALWVVSFGFNLPIGNVAHLGGLLSGIVFGLYLKYKYRKKVELLNKYFS